MTKKDAPILKLNQGLRRVVHDLESVLSTLDGDEKRRESFSEIPRAFAQEGVRFQTHDFSVYAARFSSHVPSIHVHKLHLRRPKSTIGWIHVPSHAPLAVRALVIHG